MTILRKGLLRRGEVAAAVAAAAEVRHRHEVDTLRRAAADAIVDASAAMSRSGDLILTDVTGEAISICCRPWLLCIQKREGEIVSPYAGRYNIIRPGSKRRLMLPPFAIASKNDLTITRHGVAMIRKWQTPRYRDLSWSISNLMAALERRRITARQYLTAVPRAATLQDLLNVLPEDIRKATLKEVTR